MERKHTMGDLQQMRSLPLSAKISMTKRRIMDFYDHFAGDVFVSFSGGKDSTVLKHIADGMNLGIPSLFVNTGLEYPEIQRFAMAQEHVTTIRPKMMFNEVVKKYGYPVISKEVSQRIEEARSGGEGSSSWKCLFEGRCDSTGRRIVNEKYVGLYDAPFKITHRCCDVMKKNPVHQFEKETGLKSIVATMASESYRRQTAWMFYGCNAFDLKHPRSAPMSFWTEQDVLHYIKKYDVPYCSVYGEIVSKHDKNDLKGQMTFADINGYEDGDRLECTGANRTGCMFCCFGCHREKEPNRFQRMKVTHPRQYEYCIGGGEFVDGMWQPTKKGLGLGYVLDYLGVKYE